MKNSTSRLLSFIADGQFYSGQTLASQLSVSRAAIWKSIKQLEVLGLNIEAVHGKGYRLLHPIELLDAQKIRMNLSGDAGERYRNINVLFKTDSTNSDLLELVGTGGFHGSVLFAEYQSAGRGRRGNRWCSPLASGLYFSIAWRFDRSPGELDILSLCVGVAICRALSISDIEGLNLKWPNDILVNQQKIGGILIDMRGEAGGPTDVVVGVGLNYALPENVTSEITQPFTDVCQHTSTKLSRNKLAAECLSEVLLLLEQIQSGQTAGILDEWRQYDQYQGKTARLIFAKNELDGIVQGIDEQGALLMMIDGVTQRYTSGELSLRLP